MKEPKISRGFICPWFSQGNVWEGQSLGFRDKCNERDLWGKADTDKQKRQKELSWGKSRWFRKKPEKWTGGFNTITSFRGVGS